MRFHPAQHHQESLGKLSNIFRKRMETQGILPVNPWKATRLDRWLSGMGARMKPESKHFRSGTALDCDKYVNFQVPCPLYHKRIKGYKEPRWVRIEIPWDLADKVLALGHLP